MTDRLEKNRKRKIVFGMVGMGFLTLFCAVMSFFVFAVDEVGMEGNIPNLEVYSSEDRIMDITKPVGSLENPFMVLEIVSYRGFGEMGYMAGGSEPVDLQEVLETEENSLEMFSFLSDNIEYIEDYWKIFFDGIIGDVNEYQKGNDFKQKWKNLFGKEGKEEDIEAEFARWLVSDLETKLENGYFTRVEENQGKYIINDNGSFSYVGEGAGNFNWTMDDSNPPIPEGEKETEETLKEGEESENIEEAEKEEDLEELIGEQIWVQNQEFTSGYFYKGGYKNKELLKQTLLQTTDETQLDNYYVKVITVTPEELNENVKNKENTFNYIEMADMIYISKRSEPEYVWFYENYSETGKNENVKFTKKEGNKISYQGTLPNFYDINNDLSWEVVDEIFGKVAQMNRLPIIFDSNVYENPGYTGSSERVKNIAKKHTYSNFTTGDILNKSGYCNNIQKLYLMCNFMDPGMFYTLYQDEITTKEVTLDGMTFTTGVFKKVGSENTNVVPLYWNVFTFIKLYSNQLEDYENREAYWNGLGMSNASNALKGETMPKERVWGNVFTINDEVTLTSVDTLDILYDLTKYKEENSTIYKKSIHVLDLEPCAVQSAADYTKMGVSNYKDYIATVKGMRTYLGNSYAGDIKITYQWSNEFNGKIENINELYDLIYLGLNPFTLERDGSGVTKYNDTKLKGKIYLHVGDLVYTNGYRAGGIWSSSYSVNWIGDTNTNTKNTARQPGNDISNRKREELEEYLEAGYPILVTSNLYKTGTSTTKGYVDDSSYIYKLIDENKGDYTNTLLETSKDEEAVLKLKKAVAHQKPVLKLKEDKPIRYVGKTKTSDKGLDTDYAKFLEERKLEFEFTIGTPGKGTGKKYYANVYVDTNADGRFDPDTERIQKGEYGSEYEDGNTITYKISRILTSDYIGAIPWKLEIVDVANSTITMSETGMSAVKAQDSSEVKPLRILQVNQAATYYDWNSKSFKNQTDENCKSTLNLQTEYNRSSSLFYKYLRQLGEYDIQIKTITIEEFEKLKVLDGGAEHKFDNTDVFSRMETDVLVENYDMIIFGFADFYGNISNTVGSQTYNAMYNAMYFIENGKSVLFTHDVTSFNNDAAFDKCAGFMFDTQYRGILSMDRFNIRNTNEESPLVGTDTAWVPDSLGGGIYPQQHGYSSWALHKIGANDKSNTTAPLMAVNNTVQSYKLEFSETNHETTRVSKLNDGQITQYPYFITDLGENTERINVTTTHGQYYQLNMEDENVVVWYCLAGDIGNSNSQPYQYAYNDASNNYFIYNKGNITYSGVGHRKVGSVEDEVKLFVNTMVCAYRNAIMVPRIELTDISSVKIKNGEYNVFVDYDFRLDEEANFEEDTYQYIYFTPQDDNLLSPELTVSVNIMDGSERKPNSDDLEIYKVSENPEKNPEAAPESYKMDSEIGKTYTLQNGGGYMLKYPKSDLNDRGTGKIMFIITNAAGVSGSTIAEVKERGLFILD